MSSTVDRTLVPSLLCRRPRRLRLRCGLRPWSACQRALLIISAFGNLERGALALPHDDIDFHSFRDSHRETESSASHSIPKQV